MYKIVKVYLLDTKDHGNIKFLKQFTTIEEAKKQLRDVALSYVVREEGERHREIAFQDDRYDPKSIDENTRYYDIRYDDKLRTGLYLQTQGELIILLQKSEQATEGVLPGLIGIDHKGRSKRPVIEQIGYFGVTEIEVDIHEEVLPELPNSPPPYNDEDEDEDDDSRDVNEDGEDD